MCPASESPHGTSWTNPGRREGHLFPLLAARLCRLLGGGRVAVRILLRLRFRLQVRASALSFRVVDTRVGGLGFRVQGSGFRVQGSGFWVWGLGFRVQGSGFRVWGEGFKVLGLGFGVGGLGCV